MNGTNEIGVTLPNSSDGVNQCKSICRWITDCENFSWKEGQCKLIKFGEASENNENIHQLVRVSYDIGSIYGKYDCDQNCACAARACNTDRSFSIDRYNVFINRNTKIHFPIKEGELEKCREICDLADECNYFSIYEDKCYLKWEKSNPVRLEYAESANKLETLYENHVFYSGDDLVGPSLMTVDAEKCRDLCLMHPDCSYFTWLDLDCYLKEEEAYLAFDSFEGAISGAKDCELNNN